MLHRDAARRAGARPLGVPPFDELPLRARSGQGERGDRSRGEAARDGPAHRQGEPGTLGPRARAERQGESVRRRSCRSPSRKSRRRSAWVRRSTTRRTWPCPSGRVWSRFRSEQGRRSRTAPASTCSTRPCCLGPCARDPLGNTAGQCAPSGARVTDAPLVGDCAGCGVGGLRDHSRRAHSSVDRHVEHLRRRGLRRGRRWGHGRPGGGAERRPEPAPAADVLQRRVRPRLLLGCHAAHPRLQPLRSRGHDSGAGTQPHAHVHQRDAVAPRGGPPGARRCAHGVRPGGERSPRPRSPRPRALHRAAGKLPALRRKPERLSRMAAGPRGKTDRRDPRAA